MKVELHEVNTSNFKQCILLKPSKEQQAYVAPNELSIAQSKIFKDWFPLCIYVEGVMVGFTMYGVDPDDNNMWIRMLMIDERYQRRGYGKAAIKALLEHIQQKHRCCEVYISIQPEHTIARKVYQSVGFKSTRKVIGGEWVFQNKLQNVESDMKKDDGWIWIGRNIFINRGRRSQQA